MTWRIPFLLKSVRKLQLVFRRCRSAATPCGAKRAPFAKDENCVSFQRMRASAGPQTVKRLTIGARISMPFDVPGVAIPN
jgi:hypothetical protein